MDSIKKAEVVFQIVENNSKKNTDPSVDLSEISTLKDLMLLTKDLTTNKSNSSYFTYPDNVGERGHKFNLYKKILRKDTTKYLPSGKNIKMIQLKPFESYTHLSSNGNKDNQEDLHYWIELPSDKSFPHPADADSLLMIISNTVSWLSLLSECFSRLSHQSISLVMVSNKKLDPIADAAFSFLKSISHDLPNFRCQMIIFLSTPSQLEKMNLITMQACNPQQEKVYFTGKGLMSEDLQKISSQKTL